MLTTNDGGGLRKEILLQRTCALLNFENWQTCKTFSMYRDHAFRFSRISMVDGRVDPPLLLQLEVRVALPDLEVLCSNPKRLLPDSQTTPHTINR